MSLEVVDLEIELESYRSRYSAEQELWFDVLTNAYLGVHGLTVVWGARTREQRKQKKIDHVLEDRAWFLSSREDPGSYLWVCNALGIEPEVILAQLHARGLLSGGVIIQTGVSCVLESLSKKGGQNAAAEWNDSGFSVDVQGIREQEGD